MISFTFRIRKETQPHFRCDRLEDQQKSLNKEGHSFQPFWSNRVTSKNSKSTPPSSSLPRARPPSTLPSCVGLSSCTCNTPIAKGKGWKVAQRLRIRTFWLGATCSFENMTCQNDRTWIWHTTVSIVVLEESNGLAVLHGLSAINHWKLTVLGSCQSWICKWNHHYGNSPAARVQPGVVAAVLGRPMAILSATQMTSNHGGLRGKTSPRVKRIFFQIWETEHVHVSSFVETNFGSLSKHLFSSCFQMIDLYFWI